MKPTKECSSGGKGHPSTKGLEKPLLHVRPSPSRVGKSILNTTKKTFHCAQDDSQPSFLYKERNKLDEAHQQNRMMSVCTSLYKVREAKKDLTERKQRESGLYRTPSSLKENSQGGSTRAEDGLMQRFYSNQKGESHVREHVTEAVPCTSKYPGTSVNEILLDFESVRIIQEDAAEDSASDLSDSERIPIPPSPCTPPELNLRAEEIDPACFEHLFDAKYKESIYYYSDFLPPPFNSWDLQQLAMFVNTECKSESRPQPAGFLEKYIDRLLQLEWLQVQTTQNEKGKTAKARPQTAPSIIRTLKSPGKGKSLNSPFPNKQLTPQERVIKLPTSRSGHRRNVHCEENSQLNAYPSHSKVAEMMGGTSFPQRHAYEMRNEVKKRSTTKQQLLSMQPRANSSKIQVVGNIRPLKHSHKFHSSAASIQGRKTQVTAASNTSHEKDRISLIKTIHKTSGKGLNLYQSDNLRPLRRTKRKWVLTTFELEEEDKGPFPKLAGELFNEVSYNMSIRYLISGPGVNESPEVGLFSIEDDAEGHVYVHRTIDRENTPYFKIRFHVAHRVTGNIVDRSLIFIIKIKDINDNAPKFPKEEFNITIKENHDTDEPVFQVTALDKDEEDTANSRVTYSLITQTPNLKEPRFNIDPTSGLIVISGCLDYQTASSFKLLIKARDHGTPQMSSPATVNIAIEDANNHLPVFTKENYSLQIAEDKAGPGVLRLQVEDQDSPNTPAWRAKYKIVKGNEKEQFIIETDPETNEGILSVIKSVDYEGDSERRLVISVENEEPLSLCHKGKPRSPPVVPISASVAVKVLDTNDAPEFHLPTLAFQKEEGVKPGTRLGVYSAVDPDAVPNKIKYKLVHDPAGWVTVDENSGIVTAVKELDRESSYVNNSVYLIIVHAIDDGIPPKTGTGTILLYLSDISDHMPKLVTRSLDVCDKARLTPLIIKAEDNDSHPFAGPFTFKLTDDSKNIKQNWKLGKSFGDSVELLMLRSLPRGKYLVPLLILDRQGFSTKQNLSVRLCHCPDGRVCEEPNSVSVSLGGGTIAVILAALLLFLVAGCLLLQCSYGSESRKSQANLPFEEGNQTLIKYDEESENFCSQIMPDGLDYASQFSTYAEVRQGKQMSEDVNGMAPSPSLTSSRGHCDQGLCGASTMVQSRPVSGNHSSHGVQYSRHVETLHRRSRNEIVQTVGETLNQKLYHLSNLEENMVIYQPHIYAEEGKLEISGSFSSLLTVDNELPKDFLDTLGPKFAALGEICWK
ncbi:cadherin-like protein 26 isoform X2 [Dermochelys coriacea]|uniref:cadherin-like protein 26 isoform X2 n=1 Tax=Dermochelys coriacea TaxID=27794 RepID=UPI0018E72EC2|nr:cadherin-like protein 26 isoform X2 [Dermochelys coriacea]